MKTANYIVILFLTALTCCADPIKIAFSKQSNGDYKCTVVNTGEGIMFNDLEKTEFMLVVSTDSGSKLFDMVDTGRTNMHWKHLVLLLENREDDPTLNSYTFVISKKEIDKSSGIASGKSTLLGVRFFCCKVNDFRREGLKAMKMTEVLEKSR